MCAVAGLGATAVDDDGAFAGLHSIEIAIDRCTVRSMRLISLIVHKNMKMSAALNCYCCLTMEQ